MQFHYKNNVVPKLNNQQAVVAALTKKKYFELVLCHRSVSSHQTSDNEKWLQNPPQPQEIQLLSLPSIPALTWHFQPPSLLLDAFSILLLCMLSLLPFLLLALTLLAFHSQDSLVLFLFLVEAMCNTFNTFSVCF